MTRKTPKPCVGICSTTLGDDICRGCGLTADEVVGWNGYDEDRRLEIKGRLALRKAFHELEAFVDDRPDKQQDLLD